jgi:predicted AlkP superfamily pyrophosphatase or phosphodiesterase
LLLGLALYGATRPPDGTASAPPPVASATPSAVSATPAPTDDADDEHIKRVVAISIDGLTPQALRKLGPARTPALHRMIREGSTTLEARSAVESTETLPNHTTVLTGRWVDQAASGHGVTFNEDTGVTVHETAGGYVPSIFDVVHDHDGSTAMYASKLKFRLFSRSWNTHGAPDDIGSDDGRAKIDRVALERDDDQSAEALDDGLKTSPWTFSFLHVARPDEEGHDHDWMDSEYLRAVEKTDRLVGKVLDTVARDPKLRDSTVVLVTADHGGINESHADVTRPENYRVPFLAWGAGVPAGKDLYAINPGSYRDPGTGRPTYEGPQPIRNGDLANLVTDALDLPAIPGSQINVDQRLTVFG